MEDRKTKEILKSLRNKNKMTQKDMSKKLEVSISHYTKLENGFVNPSFKLLGRIKEEFNEVDMNNFFA
ncbi:helix-turn-helix domain-containing protein [Lactococcus lactis]|uniref:helix-turn-helix domain-containing protein n=1 Tax=Lactococcus lactis TaxID=1358 RepID=UPI002418B53C|nr:helix-turn-helix transcriptional regulator [Lactococcus lactis]MDG4966111.1 helix-turn-helix domain-containing protein [Lactococcus lactis]